MVEKQVQNNQEILNTDVKQDFVLYKGRFKSNALSLFGLFYLVFNAQKDLEKYNIVVSTFSEIYDLEPHNKWGQYEESILDIKWKGSFNNNMTTSLMDQFLRMSQEPKIKDQLFDTLTVMDHDSSDTFMYDLVNRIIQDKNLILETDIQHITKEEFIMPDEQQEVSAQGPGQLQSIAEGSAILVIEPILAPVKGKPIYELKIGDTIMAKLTPNTDRANYYIDLLDLRVENHIKPVPCEIVDIKAESKNDPVEIMTFISSGIYGRCIEDERQVKIRLYNPSVDGSLPDAKKEKSVSKRVQFEKSEEDDPGTSKMIYVLIGLFGITMLLLIILLYVFF